MKNFFAILAILAGTISTAFGQAAPYSPNNVLAGPPSGGASNFPSPRGLVALDIAGLVPSFGGLTLTNVTGSTQCLQVNSSGVISGLGSPCGSGSGAVNSVTNSDGTLTISPTTGSVVASLALAHANTWTGAQTLTFNGAGIISNTPSTSQQGVHNFSENGTLKWQLGKQTDNSFVLIDTAAATTAIQFVSNSGLTTLNRALSITNSTASTTPSTGAEIITGGLGVGGDIFAGGTGNGIVLSNSQNANSYLQAINANAGTSAAAGFNASLSNVASATVFMRMLNGTTPSAQINTGSAPTTMTIGLNNVANVTLTKGGGAQVGTPTGGDKGTGSINAAAPVFVNGTQLASLGNNTFTGVQTFQGSLAVAVRSSAAATVTVSATTDYFLCLDPTSNAIAVNLPASPATGLTYLVKDCTGQAAAHNITITPAAGNIDNGANFIMNTNKQSAAVTYTGSQWSVN